MHYYQFNVADYRKDTTYLTPLEHYIYRTLIDWYYLDEEPIPKETQLVLRRLGLGSDGLPLLQNVLADFFHEAESGYIHERIEEELAKYRHKAETARVNGIKGGRPKKPRKTQSVNLANPEKTGSKANHKPITNNQEPIKRGKFIPPTVQEIARYCSERGNGIDPQAFLNHYQANGWVRGKTKVKDWKACVRTWEKSRKATQTAFTGGI